ncbi:MAG: DNA polymerase III subunit gamma/tau [Bacteroidales bacterium]|nr:DNA polymerase III subunit gamma/tau [Bacteroidales bacterium]MCF8403945.1 DNA polymerase III subunit gamma/tau [Bacteroidales bacterium]
MENFIVSARKYRPQTFDTVVGQVSITNTLKNAIKNNHLAQAFLFCGPRGVGKTTCARILAKTINCYNLSENLEACNACESCTSFNNNASFNIHELDAASNNSVDDIRNLVDQVRIPPQVGQYKVYIIDEVHMLSPQAFNAFLKTLEEPPAYAKFILATTEKHKIIPTILSRCQIYDFKRITVEDIASHLEFVARKERVDAEPEGLHVIAQKADGALRDALSIFDQIISFSGKNITYKNVIENLNVLDYDYYFKIQEAILTGNLSSTLVLINEILDNGFDGQHFLIGFGEHLRNLLVCKDPVTLDLLEVGGRIREQYRSMSERCSAGFLLKALEISNKCDIDYKTSNHKKLHLELALMQMCTLESDAYSIAAKPAIASEKKQIKTADKPKPSPATQSVNPHINQVKSDETAVKPKPMVGTTYGTVSIKNHQVKKKTVEEEEDISSKPAEDFTQEKLEEVWSKLSSRFKTDQNFYITLTSNKPVKKEANFEFSVNNKIQKKEMEDRKLDIMPFVKEKLNNYHLNMEIVVDEQKTQTKAYTPQEKFKKMSEKNPALKSMKDKLNLEIDF